MMSGTGQIMILNMISTTVVITLGSVKRYRKANMPLSTRKLIYRGVPLLIDEVHMTQVQAEQFLQQQGSSEKRMHAY